MNHPPEYYTSRPNLLRVAREIAAYDNPDRVAGTLATMLAAYDGTEPPASLPEGQNNNERFNALLNSCQNPRTVYNALLAFAEAGKAVSV